MDPDSGNVHVENIEAFVRVQYSDDEPAMMKMNNAVAKCRSCK